MPGFYPGFLQSDFMEQKELEHKVAELLPKECQLARVEPEGLELVLYLKNIAAFYQNDQLIRTFSRRGHPLGREQPHAAD